MKSITTKETLMIFYSCIVVLCELSGLTKSESTIVSESQRITASPRNHVTFKCTVKDIGNHVVQWRFLEHNMVISEDDLLKHNSGKYSINTDVVNGGYDLNIFDIETADQGNYKCEILKTSKSQISFLHVAGTPTSPSVDPNKPPANFTDCCVRESVSSYCVPLCSPSSFISTGFDSSKCSADLLKLIKCGSDGRNHVTCCRQRDLPSYCLDYCMGKTPTNFNVTEQAHCLNSAVNIIMCYEEGQSILPSPPSFPGVSALSSSSLTASWNTPLENGDKVTGYRVFYQKAGDPGYQSSPTLNHHQNKYVIEGLLPFTEYRIYVIAFNSHGASLPSYTVSTRTKGAGPLPSHTDPLDLLACCRRRSVSDKCQSFLCGGPYIPLTAQDKVQCYTQVDRVYSCLADEQDHEQCCIKRGIPGRCLTLCKGKIITTVFDNLDCIELYMGDVASCIQEGSGKLPGPPENITISSVTSNSAILKWEEPTQLPEKVTGYFITYKTMSDFFPSIKTVVGLEEVLRDLHPNTVYEVDIKSLSAVGSSLPSETIVFLTYTDSSDIVPPTQSPKSTTEVPAHDVMKCCEEQNVDANCQVLCDYKANHSQFSTDFYLGCEQFVGDVLACGVDGRNHEPCCTERGVSDQCLKFCSFSKNQSESYHLNLADIPCVPFLDRTIQCMQEGVSTIPSEPRNLHLLNVTQHTIFFTWNPPLRNPDKVTGYIVSFKDLNTTIGILSQTTQSSFIIQNLKADRDYYIEVLSVSSTGESLPSVGLTVRTLSTNYIHEINITLPDDFTACCKDKNMSSGCLSICSGSSLVNLHQCGHEVGIALECAADKRDHKPCCERSRVMPHCLKFCEGDIDVQDFTSLLCMAYTEQTLACFREGYDKLPKVPDNFQVQDLGSRHVQLAWDEPTSIQDGLQYILYYKEEMSQGPYNYFENVNSPYTLVDLQPLLHYQLFIIAVNTYGSSLPSPIITIWTLLEEGPEVHAYQEPQGVLKNGTTSVILKCESLSNPTPEIYWQRNEQKIENSQYVIKTVTPKDQGRYTCIAKAPDGRLGHSDLYVTVQYPVRVKPLQTRVEVPPFKAMTAMLECDFSGYPDNIRWYKNGQEPIPPINDSSHRYIVRRSINQDEGYISSQLVITQVRRVDYGRYSCTGENSFNRVIATIDLSNPEPDVTTPPMTPAPPIKDVKACCDKRVHEDCLVACSFDIDFSQILALDNPTQCINDLPVITSCAADGRNHTQCCVNKKVPPQCLPFCLGIVEELDDSHVICISFYEKIIDCMEEGLNKIPNAPVRLKGKISQGYIQLQWEEPTKNPEYVTYYDIHYQDGFTGTNIAETVNHQIHNVKLKAIHSFTTYKIYVIARNHYGQSHPSNNITIRTQELLPSVPRNLIGNVVKETGTDISLQWHPPIQNPGAVVKYNVYYHISTESSKQQTIESTDSHFLVLKQLKENTNYVIYVTAKTAHFESAKSNVVTVHTIKSAVTIPAPTSNKEAIGIGVGVSVAIVVLVLITLAVGYYLIRLRGSNKHHRFTDSGSVSFENSGFSKPAHVEITGIPGEAVAYSDADLQPSDFEPRHEDSSIMKEVPDHTYVTPANNGTKMAACAAMNPLYATLDVKPVTDSGCVQTDSNSTIA